MRCLNLRHSSILALVAVLAACADQPTAPRPDVQGEAAGKIIVNFLAEDRQSARITVTRSGGVFELGPHAVHIPGNVICDPRTSSYGATEWDKPCTPLRDPIDIEAKIVNIGGHEQLYFTPSLRFVPSGKSDRWVWIFMKSSGVVNESAQILWAPSPGAPAIDESLTDPTLTTRYSQRLGMVYRRIKHFSGYQVSLGFSGSADADDDRGH